MRALAKLAVLVVLGGALTGCVGGDTPDDTVNQTGTGVAGAITTGTGAGLPTGLTVRAPLVATLTTDGPVWVASGSTVAANVTPPANANGTVTYLWALGPLPGAVTVTPAKADTGSSKGADYIAPGTSKSLTYSVAGIYRMHCHPHPYMRSNVTVIDGYTGASQVSVYIVDGDKPSDARYVPENIVVGKGTTVTYHNIGSQPHSATSQGPQEPPLKKLPLTGSAGDVTIEGEGWMRVVVAILDSDGRVGIVEKAIYTTATLPTLALDPFAFEFQAGAPDVPNSPSQVAAAQTATFTLDHPADLTVDYAFTDAASAAQNMAEVEIHLTPQGETQDVMTADKSASGSWTGKALAGTYTLTVIPRQGVNISGTVTIAGAYELTPPAVGAPAEGAGHGEHAGH